MAILALGGGVVLFGWWFMVTYGDPHRVILLFALGSVVLAFLAGRRFSGGNDDEDG